MIHIRHNTCRKSDGKPMQAAGQRGSFIKYLFDAVKGHAVEGLSPIVEYRPNDWHSAFAGGPTPVHVAYVGNDWFVISVKRPAGRGGIAQGKHDVLRHVTVRSTDDLQAFIANIVDHPNGITIHPMD